MGAKIQERVKRASLGGRLGGGVVAVSSICPPSISAEYLSMGELNSDEWFFQDTKHPALVRFYWLLLRTLLGTRQRRGRLSSGILRDPPDCFRHAVNM